MFYLHLEYDTAIVPIVYPQDNLDPSTLENELERQEAEKRKQKEAEERLRQEEQERIDEKNRLEQQQREDLEREREKQREKELELEREREQEREQEREEEKERDREDQENHIIPPTQQEYLTTSTTVRPTKRRPHKQDPICKLPVEPEVDVDFDAGYRFGTSGDSRIEFTQIPAKIKKSYDISLQFKTTEPNGVLFYAADSRHTDFIALYLKNGYVSDYTNLL